MCISIFLKIPQMNGRKPSLITLAIYAHNFTRSTEDAQVIFRDAGEYNMTGEGHVWIVTEQALFSNNTPDGVLGLQLEHAHSDKGHIRVSGTPPPGI